MVTRNVQTVCLVILTILAVGTVLHSLQMVFNPLIVACLLTIVLTPLVIGLEKLKIPRFMGIVVVLGILFFFSFIVGRLFYTSLHRFVQIFGPYQKRLTVIFDELLIRFSIPPESIPEVNWARSVVDAIVQMSGSFVSFVTGLSLVIFFLVFMLAETPLTWRKFRRAFPERYNRRMGKAIGEISSQIARYLAIKSAISVITGFFVWLTLTLVGQDLAVFWGLMAFLLNFIPNVGSAIIMGATMLMALAQFFPLWDKIIIVWILMPGIQLLIGNLLDPMVQGDQLDLSPMVILFSLVLWGWILGIVGMFLSIPLTVILKISLAHNKDLQPFAVMMGTGRMSRAFRRQWIRHNSRLFSGKKTATNQENTWHTKEKIHESQ